MMRKTLSSVLGVALALGVLAGAPGCINVARPATDVEVAPPEPRAEAAPAARAGYTWVVGHWQWVGGQWRWHGGHWERARNGSHWVPGYWDHRNNRYYWVDGHWEPGAEGGVTVTPNPGNTTVVVPANPGNGGVIVRDHTGDTVVTPPPPPPNPGVLDPKAAGTPCENVRHFAGEAEPILLNGWDCSMGAGLAHHEHAHDHPHPIGDHHHHPHAHPHRAGPNGHHHPY